MRSLSHSHFPAPGLSGLLLVMFAASLWATVGVATELVPLHSGLPREVYGFVRTLLAGPAILLMAALAGGRAALLPRHGSAGEFFRFGFFCAVFQLCLFRSFDLLGVTITVFLTVCLPPLIAIAWSVLRRTERVAPHVLLAFLLGAAGLLAVVGGVPKGEGGGNVLLGLALSLAAAVAFVLMTASGRRLAAGHSPLLIAGYGLLAAALILLPLVFISTGGDPQRLATAFDGWRSAGVLVYLGLVPTALAYICYCCGMARCASATPGLVASMIEPAVAAALAFVLLHEALTPLQALGCGVIMAAMLLLACGGRAPRAISTAEPLRGRASGSA